jgi:hypothetical protein
LQWRRGGSRVSADDPWPVELLRLLRLLAVPGRLEFLAALGRGPATSFELAEQTGRSLGVVSAHLMLLHRARLVQPVTRGRRRSYGLASACRIIVSGRRTRFEFLDGLLIIQTATF